MSYTKLSTNRRARSTRAPRLRHLALCATLVIASTAACTPRVDVRGHVTDPDALSEIQPGAQTREQVAELLGTPSTIATFDDTRWYYITRRTETVAFSDPELTEQNIVMIEFDETGLVKEVASLDPAEAREIDPVAAESPTRGRSLGLLEQLFGNVGAPSTLAQ
jgi:outer membrane protein assembly factor BamE (lipoprotein component of BamABCDE complex)